MSVFVILLIATIAIAIVLVAAGVMPVELRRRAGNLLLTPGKKALLLTLPAIVVMAAAAIYLFKNTPLEAEFLPVSKSSALNANAIFKGTSAAPSAAAPATPTANSGGDLSVMAKRLANKMQQNPKDGQGWLLLARTYGELRQPADAAAAYRKAAALLPPDAGMLADWADAYVISHDRKWDAEAREIVNRAITADPKHLKSLSLAGSEAYERADYKAAINFWARMKDAAPVDSIDAKLAASNLKDASEKLAKK